MTVSTTITRQIYPGNGSATTFTFFFAFPEGPPIPIEVSITDPQGNTFLLAQGAYSLVPNSPTASNPTPVGGTVVYNPVSGPLPLGWTLTIARNLPILQETSLQNQQTLYQSSLEAALDYGIMVDQQILEQAMLALTTLKGPIQGVVDGSVAAPGMVGEYINAITAGILPPSTATQTFTTTPLVLPPGDWDIQAYLEVNQLADGAQLQMVPVPGIYPVRALSSIGTPFPEQDGIILISNRAQAAIGAPAQLTFSVNVSGLQVQANWDFTVTARRMR
jgi:hypothetical protein